MAPYRNPDDLTTTSGGQAAVLALLIWIGLALLSGFRYAPPAPVSSTAPGDQFSAERAEPILQDLVGDNIPHPAGTEQNRVVRERIVKWLANFGYEPQIHATFSDGKRTAGGRPIPLFNILARLKGLTEGPPVMIVAHYDSHPAGPGASDDGVGTTALLEIARMLKTGDPPQRDVVFLVTDGEEFNLLGAEQFMAEKDWARDIHSVVNLEARGTKGPSLMFETGSESLWAIQVFAKTSRKPFTSSLFVEIYRRMPNDTDFTVFTRYGLQGLNFAYIGDVKNYHTPDDNLENTDRGSLQHHGENALGLIREMANADLDSLPAGRAVYFDLYGWRVVWWPAKATIWIAAFATLMCLLTIWKIQKTGGQPIAGLVRSIVTLLVLLALTGGALYAVNFCLRLDSVLDTHYPARPVVVGLTYWLAALVVVAAVAYWDPLKVSWHDTLSGVLLIWSALGIVTAIYVTGGSYLLIVPAVVMGIAGVPVSYSTRFLDRARQSRILILTPPIIVGLIWMPLERLFYDAVGFGMFAAMALRITLVAGSLVPVLMWTAKPGRLNLLYGCGALFVIAVIAATMLN